MKPRQWIGQLRHVKPLRSGRQCMRQSKHVADSFGRLDDDGLTTTFLIMHSSGNSEDSAGRLGIDSLSCTLTLIVISIVSLTSTFAGEKGWSDETKDSV